MPKFIIHFSKILIGILAIIISAALVVVILWLMVYWDDIYSWEQEYDTNSLVFLLVLNGIISIYLYAIAALINYIIGIKKAIFLSRIFLVFIIYNFMYYMFSKNIFIREFPESLIPAYHAILVLIVYRILIAGGRSMCRQWVLWLGPTRV